MLAHQTPDANHGAGIFSYKSGSFWGFLCRYIFQHHGVSGNRNPCVILGAIVKLPAGNFMQMCHTQPVQNI